MKPSKRGSSPGIAISTVVISGSPSAVRSPAATVAVDATTAAPPVSRASARRREGSAGASFAPRAANRRQPAHASRPRSSAASTVTVIATSAIHGNAIQPSVGPIHATSARLSQIVVGVDSPSSTIAAVATRRASADQPGSRTSRRHR